MKSHRVAVIPGDGLGNAVMPEGVRCVDATASRCGLEIEWKCKGIAHPVGRIWSGALRLDHLGHADASAVLVSVFEGILCAGRDHAPLTLDVGATGGTRDVDEAIVARISAHAEAVASP